MATLKIDLPDDTCKRLYQLAHQRHMSLSKLMEELMTTALTQHALEAHFAARTARGSVEAGLLVLDELDARDAGRTSQ